jgi:2-methylaconitate cis-trans-isomerase PrpF
MMGMGDVTGQVVPKFCLVAPPRHGNAVTSRYFVPENCHAAHAVTGGLCLAAACVLPGSVTEGVAVLAPGPRRMIVIGHPSGTLATEFELEVSADKPVIKRAAFVRTARKIMDGVVYVPGAVWSGHERVRPAKAA